MSEPVVFAPRYCGVHGAAHEGYVAGRLAAQVGGSADATFRRPVPLERELQLDADTAAGTLELSDEGELLVTVQPSQVAVDVPPAATAVEAASAAERFLHGRAHHPFAHCFACGSGRAAGDGLRIFAGPVGRDGLHAAPWTPHPGLAGANGAVAAEFVWAALSCPGAFAVLAEDCRTLLLAWFAVRIDALPLAGEPHVVAAWPTKRAGGRRQNGVALYSPVGQVLAAGGALWLDPESA